MRVVTWNVLGRFAPDWRVRERGILATLERLRADVIGLQECWADADRTQAVVVGERLALHSAFAGPPPPAGSGAGDGVRSGVGLASRWPIIHSTEHRLPTSHGQLPPVALEATLDHPDGPLRVIVASTEWESRFADDHLAQTRELARLLAEGTAPSMLLADLNCDPTQAPFAPLMAVADDAWALGGGDPDAVTLSSAVPFAPLEAVTELDRRIDHVLVRGGRTTRFVVTGAAVVDETIDGAYPSDHFPVVVDLETRSAR